MRYLRIRAALAVVAVLVVPGAVAQAGPKQLVNYLRATGGGFVMFEHDFGQTYGCQPTTYGVAKDSLNDEGVFCIDRMSFTFTGVLEGRKLIDAEYWCLETPPPSPTGQRLPQLAGRWTGGWYNLAMTSTDSSGVDRSWPCRLVGGRGILTMTLAFGAGEGTNGGIGPAWIDVTPEGSSLRHRLNGNANISVTDQSIYDVRAGNLSMTLEGGLL